MHIRQQEMSGEEGSSCVTRSEGDGGDDRPVC